MRIDILTLFPDTLGDVLSESILGRAQERGYISIEAHQIRDYTANKQNQVDDYPYGGGRGAIMQADPLYRCWEAVCDEAGGPVHTVYLSPCGHTFRQADAIRLSKLDNLILVCGHYEGIDQRFIDECVDEEISLGDFVLTGGEIAAMAVTDAVCRMVPGVLADPECFEDESHFNGLLEYPQYSRPAVWHGREVPQILLSGNHEKVRLWRRKQALRRTRARRPDMYEKLDLSSKQDRKLLKEMEAEDLESGLLKRREALENRLSGLFEKRNINGMTCFARPDGSFFTLDCLISYGAVVVGYAESEDDAMLNRFEDGDLFYMEDMDEEAMYQSVLREIEQ